MPQLNGRTEPIKVEKWSTLVEILFSLIYARRFELVELANELAFG